MLGNTSASGKEHFNRHTTRIVENRKRIVETALIRRNGDSISCQSDMKSQPMLLRQLTTAQVTTAAEKFNKKARRVFALRAFGCNFPLF
jgi:hypothetical protein